jgi:hypothetical protein
VKDWDTLQKPWSREDCRDRYVIGDKIGLRKLAEISGLDQRRIERWSSADNWPENRRQFLGTVSAKTQESVSDAIAEKASAVIERHYEAFKELESLALSLITLSQQCADQLATAGAVDPYRLQALTGASTNASSVLRGSTDGQRQALWLDTENINVAIGIVEKHGYRVSEADAEDTAADQKIPDQNFIEVAPDDVPPTP